MDSSLRTHLIGGGVYSGAGDGTQQTMMVTQWPMGQQTPLDIKKVQQPRTPISLLHECASRKRITVNYELVSADGKVHERIFVFRATVGNMTGTGQGRNKQLAKHFAAKSILERVIAEGKHMEWGIPGRTPAEATEYLNSLMPEEKELAARPPATATGDNGAAKEPAAENSVGQLQDKCMKNRWPVPIYECQEERGPAHQRTFVVSVKLGKFEEKAEGSNKKVAKRLAAEKMLSMLKTKAPEGLDAESDKFLQAFRELGHPVVKPLTAMDKQRIEAFFGPLIRTPGENLRVVRGRQLGDLKPEDYSLLLNRIAEEHRFTINYMNLDRRTDGDFQCLVQLSAVPVAVCYGHGKTEKESQYNAARNALEYLKVMSNKEH